MTRTLRDCRSALLSGLAKKAAKFAVRVVLPTPPFRLATVRMSLPRFGRLSMAAGGCGLIVSHNPGPPSLTASRARATLLQQSHQDGRILASHARNLRASF